MLSAQRALCAAQNTTNMTLNFINTSFENASPLWYEIDADGVVNVRLLYDHERESPNRAAGHIHFRLDAAPGSDIKIEFKNLDNVWNGKHGSIARELKAAVISENGLDWTPVPLDSLPGDRVRLTVRMPGPSLYVARTEPYRLSDLDRLLASLRDHPLAEITPIGETVEGRELEIVRVGDPKAPYRVFIRARSHPWESGTNWVAHGLINRMLGTDDEVQAYRERYCVWIMPMANKDGVVRGRTRFNVNGMDLNRNWDRPADPMLAPENHALEQWLVGMIEDDRKPHLALDLHNDGRGLLHISRGPSAGLQAYLDRMASLENALRRHTWFTEGSTGDSFHNSGTLGEGWLDRYGVDALIHEFNCHWIAGLNELPTGAHWQTYGARLAAVFFEYFDGFTVED